MVRKKLRSAGLNLRSLVFALLVHVALFTLIGLNLSFTKSAKPIAQKPLQAVVINDLPLPVPQKEPEPKVEKQPEPEPIVIEPEPEPEPVVEKKPEPKPKPKPKTKLKFKYECDGVVYEVDSAAEAKRLQEQCDAKLKAEQQKKKKAAEDKAKKELEKKKQAEQRKQEELKQKKLAEEKKKQDELEQEKLRKEKLKKERKKKEEAEKKKKAEAERKRKEAEKKKREEERKQKIAEQKRRAEQARQKAAADQRAKEQALLAQIEGERIQGEKNNAWGAAVGRIKQAVNNEFNLNLFSSGLRAYYIIQLQPGGFVVSVKVKRSSGNPLYDEEGRRAILKASPLPIPQDPRFFERIIEYDHSN